MEESIFDKYRKQIKEVFSIDDKAVDMLSFEAGRLTGMTTLSKHTFLFHGLLAIITNLLFPLKGMKRNAEATGDEDFIFVSCPDSVFRTKTIGQITGELKYRIFYLPNFRIPATLAYHKFFKAQGIQAYFMTIKLKYVFNAWLKVRRFLKATGSPIQNIEGQKMASVLSSFAIYDQVVKEYLSKCKSFKGKWILEHDKFYFMSSVINLHKVGKECTMLQHGVFFRPSFNYIPLYCDKVLCCSEREKKIYIEKGVTEDRIKVFGAPLQTLQLKEEKYDKNTEFDLLVMLTLINDENIGLIKKVMEYVRNNYKNVLVRMRPRSRKDDKVLLADVLQGMTLNEVGSSIMDDLSRCRKVVSFSEDANVEIAKLNKPFVFVWTEGEKDASSMGRCATEDTFKEEINKLMTQDFYSTFSKEQYKNILGESDVNVLRERFKHYIKG